MTRCYGRLVHVPYSWRITILSADKVTVLDPVAAFCTCMGLSPVVRPLACTRRPRRGAVLELFANYGGFATGVPFILLMGRSSR
jgi:hypothetical protein